MSYSILVDERYLETIYRGLLTFINPNNEIIDWIHTHRTEEKFAYMRLGLHDGEITNRWYCEFDDEEMALQFKLTFG